MVGSRSCWKELRGQVRLRFTCILLREPWLWEKLPLSWFQKFLLTPQMTNRFISRFGDLVAIMHSGLSDGEKFDEWRKVRSGQAKVVVGARSWLSLLPWTILEQSLSMRSTRRPISRNPILAIMLEMWPCLGPKVMALFLYLVQPRLLLSRERGLRKGSTIFLN